MKRILFLHLILLGFIYQSNAQLHDANWILGSFSPFSDSTSFGIMDLDLTNDQVALNNIKYKNLEFFRSNTSYSTKDGRLLMFTNGTTFYDADGDIIPGFEDIYPDDGWTIGFPQISNTFILDNPSGDNSFLVISGNHFVFSIDNSANIGNSEFISFEFDYEIEEDAVILENIEPPVLIVSDTFSDERTAVTRHANGRDWWLLLNKYKSKQYVKVLITPEGIENYGTQTIGDSTNLGIDQPVFSPDGQFYAVNSISGNFTEARSRIEFIKFDRCTGELLSFNKKILKTHAGELEGGVAFSPSSRFMYVAVRDTIFQFDMNTDDIEASKMVVAINDEFTYTGFDGSIVSTPFNKMQLAPNGKIYISSNFRDGKYLHVIDQPDSLGLACNVLQHEVALPRYYFKGLPNFPNYRLKSLIGSPCDTLRPLAAFAHDALPLTTFTDQSDRSPTEWFWTFGDGNTSNEQNPIHQYTENGTYEVCLIASNQSGSDTTCQMINIIVTSVEDLSTASFSIYPNPTDGVVTVVLPDHLTRTANPTTYQLLNVLGQTVDTGVLSTRKIDLNFSKLESGMYWMVVEGMGVRKLVVE